MTEKTKKTKKKDACFSITLHINDEMEREICKGDINKYDWIYADVDRSYSLAAEMSSENEDPVLYYNKFVDYAGDHFDMTYNEKKYLYFILYTWDNNIEYIEDYTDIIRNIEKIDDDFRLFIKKYHVYFTESWIESIIKQINKKGELKEN